MLEKSESAGWSGAETARRLPPVTEHDVSYWRRRIVAGGEIARIAPAKRVVIRNFLGISERRGEEAEPQLDDYPSDSPAEVIIRAFSDVERMESTGGTLSYEDIVLMAYARALRERLPAEEMSKLDVWRNLLIARHTHPTQDGSAKRRRHKGGPKDHS
jgi:hypothetical protein